MIINVETGEIENISFTDDEIAAYEAAQVIVAPTPEEITETPTPTEG
jgi:hypothetical protein